MVWWKSVLLGVQVPLSIGLGAVAFTAGVTVVRTYGRVGDLEGLGGDILVAIGSALVAIWLWPEEDARVALRVRVADAGHPPLWLIPLISGVAVTSVALACVLGLVASTATNNAHQQGDLVAALLAQATRQDQAINVLAGSLCTSVAAQDQDGCTTEVYRRTLDQVGLAQVILPTPAD